MNNLHLIIFLFGVTSSKSGYAFPKNFVELPSLDGRIIGGKPAAIEEYPYQVSLQLNNQHICGGSIISKDFIVTAAHCTNGLSPENLTIRAGSTYWNRHGSIYNIKEIHENPNFDYHTMDCDISILRLDEPLIFSSVVSPIDLAFSSGGIIDEGSSFMVSGWGSVREGGRVSNELRVAQVPFVNKQDCQNRYVESIITDRMICAGPSEGGVDSCQGDSGGPLVDDGKLVGIVSWGYGCGRPQYPGVYSSVSQLRKFISSVTNF